MLRASSGKSGISNAEPGPIFVGPVISYSLSGRPLDTGRFGTTIRVIHVIRRIEVVTTLVNKEKLVRYHALFPTSIDNGRSVHEIPFGAIERPEPAGDDGHQR